MSDRWKDGSILHWLSSRRRSCRKGHSYAQLLLEVRVKGKMFFCYLWCSQRHHFYQLFNWWCCWCCSIFLWEQQPGSKENLYLDWRALHKSASCCGSERGWRHWATQFWTRIPREVEEGRPYAGSDGPMEETNLLIQDMVYFWDIYCTYQWL